MGKQWKWRLGQNNTNIYKTTYLGIDDAIDIAAGYQHSSTKKMELYGWQD